MAAASERASDGDRRSESSPQLMPPRQKLDRSPMCSSNCASCAITFQSALGPLGENSGFHTYTQFARFYFVGSNNRSPFGLVVFILKPDNQDRQLSRCQARSIASQGRGRSARRHSLFSPRLACLAPEPNKAHTHTTHGLSQLRVSPISTAKTKRINRTQRRNRSGYLSTGRRFFHARQSPK